MSKKIKIGVEIDEIFRAKAHQFNKYYFEEFGEEGIPKDPYTMDFFEQYRWSDTVETTKVIRDDIDVMSINPLDYVENEDGTANIDSFLFNTEKEELNKKEVYNRFLYQDYLFEIFGAAPNMYRHIDLDIKKFQKKYGDIVEVTIFSSENIFSIPPTLFYLSKLGSIFSTYKFYSEYSSDIENDFDIIITSNTKILNDENPDKFIRVHRPYNVEILKDKIKINNFGDLINNVEFEEKINYKNEQ